VHAGSYFARPRTSQAAPGLRPATSVANNYLALFDLPISVRLISQLQQPILGIVPLVAARTFQVPAPASALGTVIFRHREGGAATARNEIQSQRTISLPIQCASAQL